MNNFILFIHNAQRVVLNKNILYIKVTEFDNPNLSKDSRISPSILLKLNGIINIKRIIFKY